MLEKLMKSCELWLWGTIFLSWLILHNVTLSAERRLIEQARKRAEAKDTTLNAEFRRWSEQYVESSLTPSENSQSPSNQKTCNSIFKKFSSRFAKSCRILLFIKSHWKSLKYTCIPFTIPWSWLERLPGIAGVCILKTFKTAKVLWGPKLPIHSNRENREAWANKSCSLIYKNYFFSIYISEDPQWMKNPSRLPF